MSDDPEDLRDLAVSLAERAGAELLARARPGAVTTKTSARDVVSEADRGTEQLILDALADARPDDAVLAEEGEGRPGRTGLRWVVDPLDGTVNYLYGVPLWSVSIAVERVSGAAPTTVAAAVAHPLAHETFAAARGRGAVCNGAAVGVRDPVGLADALVGTGFAYRTEPRHRQARQAAYLLPRVRDLRRLGSAALDLCYVAAGRLDGFYEGALERWDWLAGGLIASEAGARVTPLDDGVLAAGPHLHGELREALAAAVA